MKLTFVEAFHTQISFDRDFISIWRSLLRLATLEVYLGVNDPVHFGKDSCTDVEHNDVTLRTEEESGAIDVVVHIEYMRHCLFLDLAAPDVRKTGCVA